MKYRTWIYHKTEEPKIVFSDEVESYFKEGWADTPAKFIELPENDLAAQNTIDAVKGVTESLNGALNLDEMTKAELVKYAKKHFCAVLKKNDNKVALLATIRGLTGLTGGDK